MFCARVLFQQAAPHLFDQQLLRLSKPTSVPAKQTACEVVTAHLHSLLARFVLATTVQESCGE